MPDQTRTNEYAEIAAEPAEPRIFYLSFVDTKPERHRWLGGCYVEADNLLNALTAAWTHGCNPGGEVATMELPPEAGERVPEEKIGVLLDEEGIEL